MPVDNENRSDLIDVGEADQKATEINLDDKGEPEKKEPRYFVNPVIKNKDPLKATFEEGCLSVPNQFAEIDRPSKCEVEYLDYNGDKQLLKANGCNVIGFDFDAKKVDIAKTKGIKVVERKIKPEEMSNFVGCFLTGTAAEITPVSQIDNYKFTVCDLIKSLSESYINLVRKKVAA